MWPSCNTRNIYIKKYSHDILNDKTYTIISTVINEMISMYLEDCQASELRQQGINVHSASNSSFFSFQDTAWINNIDQYGKGANFEIWEKNY